MKKLFGLFFSIALLLTLITGTGTSAFAASGIAVGYYPNGAVASSGDVLVTNNTSSSGLTGHAGIVTPSGIATINGYGDHPRFVSLSEWFVKTPTRKL